MEIKTPTALALTLAASFIASAQTNQPADDWKPATSNMPDQQY